MADHSDDITCEEAITFFCEEHPNLRKIVANLQNAIAARYNGLSPESQASLLRGFIECYYQEGVEQERNRITSLLKMSSVQIPELSNLIGRAIRDGTKPEAIIERVFTLREQALARGQISQQTVKEAASPLAKAVGKHLKENAPPPKDTVAKPELVDPANPR